jgi:hypothetical protein
MTVESALYINTLNPAYPAHTDGLDEADSHMRLIKQVLQATFPNVAGAAGCSDVDLTNLTAALVTLAALVVSAPNLTAENTFSAVNNFTAGLNSSTFLNGTSIQKGGFELVPTGIIAAWWGTLENIPAGWALCNGENGTPNLLDSYIVGAGLSFAPLSIGGSNVKTFQTDTQGAHNHTGATQLGGGQPISGTTDTQGLHSHSGTTQGYGLQTNDLPPHDHGLTGHGGILAQQGTGGAQVGGSGSTQVTLITAQSVGQSAPHTHPISPDGAHQHNLTVSPVAAHTHPVSVDGAHLHNITVNVQPQSVAMCWIMKL